MDHPPQLDLESGETSTLLDVVSRPQAGTLEFLKVPKERLVSVSIRILQL